LRGHVAASYTTSCQHQHNTTTWTAICTALPPLLSGEGTAVHQPTVTAVNPEPLNSNESQISATSNFESVQGEGSHFRGPFAVSHTANLQISATRGKTQIFQGLAHPPIRGGYSCTHCNKTQALNSTGGQKSTACRHRPVEGTNEHISLITSWHC